MRRTKIIATLGPATAAPDDVAALVAAGVDVMRLNFSHGSQQSHGRLFAQVRDAARQAGRFVAILQDLAGPKIRTGPLEGGRAAELVPGAAIVIETGDFAGNAARVSTGYAGLAASVKPGQRLLLDDGRLELEVRRTDGVRIEATVVSGGPLGEHKGINAPGVRLPDSALTPKDLDDLRFGVSLGVDMVGLSFVQTADDVRRLREHLVALDAPGTVIVSKIERRAAVASIDEILAATDAIMVARGDLGLEMPLEHVPRIQWDLTKRAREQGVPVIVATQVLDSMRSAPRPTRAEMSDAANAVRDSVDALMLSGETAIGRFPIRAVQALDAVIRDAESMPAERPADAPATLATAHSRALCEAAVTLADVGGAAAIIAVTRSGRTARVLSALRPGVPILASTTSDELARRLVLLYGVAPTTTDLEEDPWTNERHIEQQLAAGGMLAEGNVIVFVNVHTDLTRWDANFLSLRRLGGERAVAPRPPV